MIPAGKLGAGDTVAVDFDGLYLSVKRANVIPKLF